MAQILRTRQRGVTLIEAVLALSVAMGLIGLSAGFIASENAKQEKEMIASEQDVLLKSSRNFVEQRYNTVVDDLFSEAKSGGSAIRAYSMDDVIASGFLPESYNGGILRNLYGHDYTLMARLVLKGDGTTPKATLDYGDLDPTASGILDATLIDGDDANDELAIEAILSSKGDMMIPRGVRGDVIGMMGTSFSGSVEEVGVSLGTYGSFMMDISGFEDLDAYPNAGSFGSIVSLSDFGVIGQSIDRKFILDPFARCVGVNIATVEYEDCLASNEVYGDIVLRPHDSNGDGSDDTYPALRNVTMLDCREESETGVQDEFTIDCATTNITGDLVVSGASAEIVGTRITAEAINFGGNDVIRTTTRDGNAELDVSADRFIQAGVGPDGKLDMSEVVSSSRVVQAGSLVPMPTCPATALDGVTPMQPRIYVTPAAYADPRGRPIVGVRAFGEEEGSNWRVKLLVYVAQDFCNNTTSNPLDPAATTNGGDMERHPRLGWLPTGGNCMTFNAEGDVDQGGSSRKDGNADIYELRDQNAAVIVQTRCY
ncbi:hypothetical protein [Paracoccus sp. ME4]|uniref:type IV pilus modification PilV family protein n=1 Tax=Paracoccus sp. ME4 TaxID=3138066 RepID=UPI00398A560A